MMWAYSCFGVLVSLAFIGVGATVVRAARPTSGYLFIAAGALELLAQCCSTATAFPMLRETDMDYDTVRLVMMGSGVLGALETIVFGVLVALALAGLAKELRARTA